MRPDDPTPPGEHAAVLPLGIVHPDARIDREDGRTARGRLQRQAMRAGTWDRGPAFAISSWSPTLVAP